MSGKHDKSADDEKSANLLLTGPIVIRGLGRGVKDALRPGRPSRHRAFVGEESVEADAQAAAAVPPSAGATQDGTAEQAFPEDDAVAQTEVADGPEEDRVDDRREDDEASVDVPAEDHASVLPDAAMPAGADEAAPEPPSEDDVALIEERLDLIDEPDAALVADEPLDADDDDAASRSEDDPEPASIEGPESTDLVVDEERTGAPESDDAHLEQAAEPTTEPAAEPGDDHHAADVSEADAVTAGGSDETAAVEDEPSEDPERAFDDQEPPLADEVGQVDDVASGVDAEPDAHQRIEVVDLGSSDEGFVVEAEPGNAPSSDEPAAFGDAEPSSAEASERELESDPAPEPALESFTPADEPIEGAASEDEPASSVAENEPADDEAAEPDIADALPFDEAEAAAPTGRAEDEPIAEPGDGAEPETEQGDDERPEVPELEGGDVTEAEHASTADAEPEQSAQLTESVDGPVDGSPLSPDDPGVLPAPEEQGQAGIEPSAAESSDEVDDWAIVEDAASTQPIVEDPTVDDQPVEQQVAFSSLAADAEEFDAVQGEPTDGQAPEAESDRGDVASTPAEGEVLDATPSTDDAVRDQVDLEDVAALEAEEPEEREQVDVEEATDLDWDGVPEEDDSSAAESEEAEPLAAEQEVAPGSETDSEPESETSSVLEEPADGADEPVRNDEGDDHDESTGSGEPAEPDASEPIDDEVGGFVAAEGSGDESQHEDGVHLLPDQPADGTSASDPEHAATAEETSDRVEASGEDLPGAPAEPTESASEIPAPVGANDAAHGADKGDEGDEGPHGDADGEWEWTTAEELFNLPTVPHRSAADDEVHEAVAAEPEPADSQPADPQPTEPAPAERESAEPEPGEPEPAESEPTQPEPAEAVATTANGRDETAGRSDDQGDGEPAAPAPTLQPAATAAAAAAPAIATATGGRPPRGPSSRPSGPSRAPRRRPLRERVGREAIGIAVLVVLALVCAGLITAVVLKTQRDAAIAAKEAAEYTPPPLATPSPTATGPRVAVIGDETVATAASGVGASDRWSALLESDLKGTVDTDAARGMGYAAKSGAGETFVQAAGKVPSNAEAVVFFGGAADANISGLSLAKAATDALAAANKQAPDAKVIVVGPVVRDGASEADVEAIRNVLATSARIAKATWIDPIDADWLSSEKQSGSASSLSAADEKTIASKMRAAIEKALR